MKTNSHLQVRRLGTYAARETLSGLQPFYLSVLQPFASAHLP